MAFILGSKNPGESSCGGPRQLLFWNFASSQQISAAKEEICWSSKGWLFLATRKITFWIVQTAPKTGSSSEKISSIAHCNSVLECKAAERGMLISAPASMIGLRQSAADAAAQPISAQKTRIFKPKLACQSWIQFYFVRSSRPTQKPEMALKNAGGSDSENFRTHHRLSSVHFSCLERRVADFNFHLDNHTSKLHVPSQLRKCFNRIVRKRWNSSQTCLLLRLKSVQGQAFVFALVWASQGAGSSSVRPQKNCFFLLTGCVFSGLESAFCPCPFRPFGCLFRACGVRSLRVSCVLRSVCLIVWGSWIRSCHRSGWWNRPCHVWIGWCLFYAVLLCRIILFVCQKSCGKIRVWLPKRKRGCLLKKTFKRGKKHMISKNCLREDLSRWGLEVSRESSKKTRETGKK